MCKGVIPVAIVVLVTAVCSMAQTTVTTSGGSTGTIPVFTGTTAIANSAISQSGNNVSIGQVNSVINPAVCSNANRPSWCVGSDMGAWINAAIATLPGNGAGGSYGCGVVKLPYDLLWSYSIPIAKPRCTLIDLNQSSIGYKGPAASPAVSIYDSFQIGEPATGGIINGRIFGGTGYSPIVAGSIGIMMGGLGTSSAGFCYTNGSTSNCSATFQTFTNLEVQNFTDGWRFGANTYLNTWIGVTTAGNTNNFHFLTQNNSNENQSFHGSFFVNAGAHDILVDPGGFAEVMCEACSFDYSTTHSISGPVHFSASDSHFEDSAPGQHWFDCSGGGCSIHVKGGSAYLLGALTSNDAFGTFGGSNNQATFDGVEWGIANGNTLAQFFMWNDSSSASNLHFDHFRQGLQSSLSSASLASVPVYSSSKGAKPGAYWNDLTNPIQQHAGPVAASTGDVVIAGGAPSLTGIYVIYFDSSRYHSSMTVALAANEYDTTEYALNILSNYSFNSWAGPNSQNIANPRVVMDSKGYPQFVITLVNAPSSNGSKLNVTRYGDGYFLTLPALLSGAPVGTTTISHVYGIGQDTQGNFSINGTLRATPAIAGTATLTGGTATVSASAACPPSASCVYKLTNCGGNSSTGIGTLSIGGVTAGSSFVINSLNGSNSIQAGDASTVCWQIN